MWTNNDFSTKKSKSAKVSNLRTVRSKLLRLPQMLLLNSCDVISEFVDRKPEVFYDLVQSWSERLVVVVHEDVVDATVLE